MQHTSENSNSQIDISFKDLQFKILKKQSDSKIQSARVIIDNASGIFYGNQVTAILGGSGSGKTTLLDIFTCRIKKNEHSIYNGELMANNQSYTFNKFNHFASYVVQDDSLLETYTPREAFEFAAKFKYNNNETVKERVNQTLKNMKLESCQNTCIGGDKMEGVSGGERKRTSIGFELVTDPQVIVLDEPTSGLDSFTAFYIVNYLKELAHTKNKTIITTLHQPSSDIMSCVDRVILLTNGKIAYQGPQTDMIEYFNNIGFSSPLLMNPMDYYIGLLRDQKSQDYDYLVGCYEQKLLPKILIEINNQNDGVIKNKEFEASFLNTILILFIRVLRHYMRHPNFFRARVFALLVVGLLLGGIFWDVGNNDGSLSALFSISGGIFLTIAKGLFFLCIITAYSQALGIIIVITTEKEVLQREFNSEMYTPATYYLSRQLLEIPITIITTTVQGLIFYWMMGLQNYPINVINNQIICILLALTYNSMGMMCGCFFNDKKMALSIAPMVVMPTVTFGGLFANLQAFPKWIEWIQYLSPIKYGFEALMLNEVEGRYYKIDPKVQYHFNIGLYQCILILLGFAIGTRLLSLIFINNIRVKYN